MSSSPSFPSTADELAAGWSSLTYSALSAAAGKLGREHAAHPRFREVVCGLFALGPSEIDPLGVIKPRKANVPKNFTLHRAALIALGASRLHVDILVSQATAPSRMMCNLTNNALARHGSDDALFALLVNHCKSARRELSRALIPERRVAVLDRLSDWLQSNKSIDEAAKLLHACSREYVSAHVPLWFNQWASVPKLLRFHGLTILRELEKELVAAASTELSAVWAKWHSFVQTQSVGPRSGKSAVALSRGRGGGGGGRGGRGSRVVSVRRVKPGSPSASANLISGEDSAERVSLLFRLYTNFLPLTASYSGSATRSTVRQLPSLLDQHCLRALFKRDKTAMLTMFAEWVIDESFASVVFGTLAAIADPIRDWLAGSPHRNFPTLFKLLTVTADRLTLLNVYNSSMASYVSSLLTTILRGLTDAFVGTGAPTSPAPTPALSADELLEQATPQPVPAPITTGKPSHVDVKLISYGTQAVDTVFAVYTRLLQCPLPDSLRSRNMTSADIVSSSLQALLELPLFDLAHPAANKVFPTAPPVSAALLSCFGPIFSTISQTYLPGPLFGSSVNSRRTFLQLVDRVLPFPTLLDTFLLQWTPQFVVQEKASPNPADWLNARELTAVWTHASTTFVPTLLRSLLSGAARCTDASLKAVYLSIHGRMTEHFFSPAFHGGNPQFQFDINQWASCASLVPMDTRVRLLREVDDASLATIISRVGSTGLKNQPVYKFLATIPPSLSHEFVTRLSLLPGLSKPDTVALLELDDVSLKPVRVALEKQCHSASVEEREAAMNYLWQATLASKQIDQLQKTLAFLAKKTRNSPADVLLAVFEAVFSFWGDSIIEFLLKSPVDGGSGDAARLDAINTLAEMYGDAWLHTGSPEFSSLQSDGNSFFTSLLTAVCTHECFSSPFGQAVFAASAGALYAASVNDLGAASAQLAFELPLSDIEFELEPSEKKAVKEREWAMPLEPGAARSPTQARCDTFVETVCKFYASKAPDAVQLSVLHWDRLSSLLTATGSRWLRSPFLSGLIREMFNAVVTACGDRTDGSAFVLEDAVLKHPAASAGTKRYTTKLWFGALRELMQDLSPVKWYKVPVFVEFLEFAILTNRGSSMVGQWYEHQIQSAVIVARNAGESKLQVQRAGVAARDAAVVKLLGLSPSAIHLRLVQRHLVHHRQDLLAPFCGRTGNAFLGLFSPAPPESYWGNPPPPSTDEFLLPNAWELHRLTPALCQALADQYVDRLNSDSYPLQELKKFMIRLACLPTTTALDLLTFLRGKGVFMPAPTDARTEDDAGAGEPTAPEPKASKFPQAVIDAALLGITKDDEPGVTLDFLLSPACLGSDSARIASFGIKSVFGVMPVQEVVAVLAAFYEDPVRRRAMKVTAAKAMLRILFDCINRPLFNLAVQQWRSRFLHRDVRIAFLHSCLELLAVPGSEFVEDVWGILSGAAASFASCEGKYEPEVGAALLSCGPALAGSPILESLGEVDLLTPLKQQLDDLVRVKLPPAVCARYWSTVILPLANMSLSPAAVTAETAEPEVKRAKAEEATATVKSVVAERTLTSSPFSVGVLAILHALDWASSKELPAAPDDVVSVVGRVLGDASENFLLNPVPSLASLFSALRSGVQAYVLSLPTTAQAPVYACLVTAAGHLSQQFGIAPSRELRAAIGGVLSWYCDSLPPFPIEMEAGLVAALSPWPLLRVGVTARALKTIGHGLRGKDWTAALSSSLSRTILTALDVVTPASAALSAVRGALSRLVNCRRTPTDEEDPWLPVRLLITLALGTPDTRRRTPEQTQELLESILLDFVPGLPYGSVTAPDVSLYAKLWLAGVFRRDKVTPNDIQRLSALRSFWQQSPRTREVYADVKSTMLHPFNPSGVSLAGGLGTPTKALAVSFFVHLCAVKPSEFVSDLPPLLHAALEAGAAEGVKSSFASQVLGLVSNLLSVLNVDEDGRRAPPVPSDSVLTLFSAVATCTLSVHRGSLNRGPQPSVCDLPLPPTIAPYAQLCQQFAVQMLQSLPAIMLDATVTSLAQRLLDAHLLAGVNVTPTGDYTFPTAFATVVVACCKPTGQITVEFRRVASIVSWLRDDALTRGLGPLGVAAAHHRAWAALQCVQAAGNATRTIVAMNALWLPEYIALLDSFTTDDAHPDVAADAVNTPTVYKA